MVMKPVYLVVIAITLAAFCAAQAPSMLYLTIAYCPTDTTSAGAIVAVDIKTGNYSIVSKFKWPSEVFGCLADYDPTVTFDYETDDVYIDFMDDFGMMTVVDIPHAKKVRHVDCTDPFFVGFDNMALSGKDLKGTIPTVTESGFCSDGCFEFGELNINSGKHTKFKNIPFKATMDDSHLLEGDAFWIQASYDLRPMAQRCAPDDSDLCLVNVDAATGEMRSAVYTNYSIYKYTPYSKSENAVAFLEGFDDLCKHPYNNYLFAAINFHTSVATPIACIPKDVEIRMDEWISSFSRDASLFATGSAFSGEGQVLVFNVGDASLKLNSPLAGLGAKLGAFDKLYWIWDLNFPQGD